MKIFLLRILFALGIASAIFAQDPPPEPTADASEVLFGNAAVQQILESNPTEPQDLVRAVNLLTDLGRVDLAKDFLKKLQEANLTDNDKAELYETFGTGAFMSWIRNGELAPDGRTIALDILQAAKRVAQDPKQLAAYASQLNDDNQQIRQRAAQALVRSEEFAVPAIMTEFEKLEAKKRPLAMSLLAKIAEQEDDSLIPYLYSGTDRQSQTAARVLGKAARQSSLSDLATFYILSDSTEDISASNQAFTLHKNKVPTRSEAEELVEELPVVVMNESLIEKSATQEMFQFGFGTLETSDPFLSR